MLKFIKDWMLVIAIVSGVVIYLIYHSIPVLAPLGSVLLPVCKTLQPLLLFAMLFLSFSSVKPSDLRFYRWQVYALAFQALSFVAVASLLYFFPHMQFKTGLEAFALCVICPTATACAVVTAKLGGDKAAVLTYTILINILAAVLIPLFLPLLYPAAGMGFWTAFLMILVKIFPLLIAPCLLAWIVRSLLPQLHSKILKIKDLPFYMWAVSLMLAILMATRSIVRSGGGILLMLQILSGSLAACVLQFYTGRKIGSREGVAATCGQVMGQKNTVFAMWVGYTFMDPVTSLAGGFYSIWHNCYNTWQLRHRQKTD